MARRTWKDRVVEFPRRFKDQHGNILELTPFPGTVLEAGTPVNAANLNGLEEDLESHKAEKASSTKLGHIELDGLLKTGLNAEKVGGKTASEFVSSVKLKGKNTYQENIAILTTVTKKIPIGSGKSEGRAIIKASSLGGIMVFFTTNIDDTKAVGRDTKSNGGASSYEYDRWVTTPREDWTGAAGFGDGCCGHASINIVSMHIVGTNIEIVFRNNYSGTNSSGDLKTNIIWEVW